MDREIYNNVTDWSSTEFYLHAKQQRVIELLTIYPVTGASGGAILSPWLKIPTQLVSRDPCHSSILQGKLTPVILQATGNIWDGAQNFLHDCMCTQQRLRSASTSVQSD